MLAAHSFPAITHLLKEMTIVKGEGWETTCQETILIQVQYAQNGLRLEK